MGYRPEGQEQQAQLPCGVSKGGKAQGQSSTCPGPPLAQPAGSPEQALHSPALGAVALLHVACRYTPDKSTPGVSGGSFPLPPCSAPHRFASKFRLQFCSLSPWISADAKPAHSPVACRTPRLSFPSRPHTHRYAL